MFSMVVDFIWGTRKRAKQRQIPIQIQPPLCGGFETILGIILYPTIAETSMRILSFSLAESLEKASGSFGGLDTDRTPK